MLTVGNLCVRVHKGPELLHDVSFHLEPGQALGLTGQSGAGKSTLIHTLMGVLSSRYLVTSGKIIVDGADLYALPEKKRRKLCGGVLGFIPQNPMTAFDSRIKIGRQMADILHLHQNISQQKARDLCTEGLHRMNLTDTDRILSAYPAQLSGGMLQRVTAAILLILEPRYILADEPTGALDEENRAVLLECMAMQAKTSGVLLISHDVRALESLCGEVMVMEQGRLTERGPVQRLLQEPQRPWTREFAAASNGATREGWQWTELL